MGAPRIGVQKKAAFAVNSGAIDGKCQRTDATEPGMRAPRGLVQSIPRAIYFYHDADMPLFALTAYAKNAQADLSQQDRNDFRQMTALLVRTFKRNAS